MNGKWRIRLGAGCEVAEYWYGGEIRGVLVRAIGTDKWIPKIGGVPVGTPACKGKSENVLRDRIRSGKESSDMSNTMTKAQLEQRVKELEAKLLKAQEPAYLAAIASREASVTSPAKPAAAKAAKVQAQVRTSNWRKCQHVSGQAYVRYLDQNTYAAIVQGTVVGTGSGKNPKGAKLSAKKLVDKTLKARGVQWQPRVFS